MQDYYEILQVHPKADQEAIQGAYERLRGRYDPAQLEGAADELLELARRRRDDIERAYAILSDQSRRTAYDAELRERASTSAAVKATAPRSNGAVQHAVEDDVGLDYRPLPPARRQERTRDFDPQPVLPTTRPVQRSGRQASTPRISWTLPAVLVGSITFGVVLVSLWLAGTGPAPASDSATGAPAALGTAQPIVPTPSEEQIINQFEGQLVEARQVTQSTPDNPTAWINYGNALYDSVQVVRERMPDSAVYVERLPRWIEASNAYSEALKLQPNNAVVRADLAASLCYYGAGTSDQSYVAQGLVESRRAAQEAPQDARVLLNLGVCLVQADPPQTQEAIEQWRKILSTAPSDSGMGLQAQRLIEQYSK